MSVFGGLKRRKSEVPAHPPAPPPASGNPEAALAFLRDYEESGLGWFWASDAAGNVSYVSASVAQALDCSPVDLIGRPFISLFRAEEAGEATGRSLALMLAARKSFSELALQAHCRHQEIWWSIAGRPQFDAEGKFAGYRGNGTDITIKLVDQRANSRLVTQDSLTGLFNRHHMNQRLEHLVASTRNSQRSVTLLMLDLDKFKAVNDTLGHPVGDELLKQVARRLEEAVGKDGEIGRLGGDEFQIILPDIDDRGRLGDLAKRIIAQVSEPYSIDSQRCVIGASVGIAVAPFDGAGVEDLVRAADLALYSAKGNGRGQFRFFSIELQNTAEKRKVLEVDLRHALEQDEICLVYQPLVDATSNQVVGLEALIRWIHPEFGELPPALFIPIAEESDLIVKLGEWTLREACATAVQWPGGIHISVNVAPAQFAASGFMDSVHAALEASQLPAERLELEFSESIFATSEDLARGTFSELRQLGVRVALDNFGGGNSPLAYLRNAHFDKIKIDRSIIRELTLPRSRSAAIAASITTLAKRLGMLSVAEGIEARDELQFVQELGIDQIQGFIYSPPVSSAEVVDALATGQWVIQPEGPAQQRAERRSVYRRVGVIHEDFRYDVIMRNLSRGGAAIEGLFDVPVNTQFVLDLGEGQLIVSTVKRSEGAVQGLEFESSLVDDGAGGLVTRHRVPRHLLEAMGMPITNSQGQAVIALNTVGGINLPKFATADTMKQGKAA